MLAVALTSVHQSAVLTPSTGSQCGRYNTCQLSAIRVGWQFCDHWKTTGRWL